VTCPTRSLACDLGALLVAERGLERRHDAERVQHHLQRALGVAVMPLTQFARRLLTAFSIVAIDVTARR